MPRLLRALWLFLASSTDRELARMVEYLKEENRILRSKLPARITVTPRARLVKLGRAVGTAIRELVTIVSLRTFARWVAGTKSAGSGGEANRAAPTSKPGRPRTEAEIRELIVRLGRENQWGYGNRTRLRPARIRRSATHPMGRPRDSQAPVPPDQWIAVASVPAIVTREQFDRVQAKIATNRSFAKRNNTTTQYLLRALVSCGACRLACIARRTMPTGRTYYICSGKSIRARQDQGCRCRSKFIPAGALDELVWADLVGLIRAPDRVARALRRVTGGCGLPQELQARRENLRRGRTSVAQQIERLTDAYVGGVLKLAEYDRRRKDLERRDATLAQQQALLDGEASRAGAVQGLVDSAESFAERVRSGLDTATFERKRQLVELLIDRVVVTGDTVEIRYAFPIGPAGESGRFCHLRLDYLGAPALVRPVGLELPVEDVRGHRPSVVRVGRAHEPLGTARTNPVLPHEFGHRVLRARVSPRVQLGGHARAPVTALHLGVDRLDRADQLAPPVLGRALDTRGPRVVPGLRYLQRRTHPRDGPLAGAVGDEPERQVGGLAKYAAAFFSRSRSARRRAFSARSRRSSSSAGAGLPCPGKAASPLARNALRHSRNRFSQTSSRRAVSATESFCSVIVCTAERLKSAAYVVRGRAIGELLDLSLHR